MPVPVKTNSNLDFLRAFAVTAVVICHLTSFYGNRHLGLLGFVGVALFFVHTSLVLMQSLERQATRSLFAPFMIRRCFRIYPLAIFMVLVVAIFRIPQAGIETGHFQTIRYDLADLVANLSLSQGLLGVIPSIINPMWSLSYEMQMYLLLPFIYSIVSRATLKQTLLLYIAVIPLSFAVCYYLPRTTLFSYAPCFMAGVVAYKLTGRAPQLFKAYWWPVLLLGITVSLLNAMQFAPTIAPTSAPVNWWALCACVGFTLPLFKQLSSSKLTMVANYIAKFSYGVYVSHCFCMWATLEHLQQFSVPRRLLAFAVLLSIVSVTLYYVIERPFIELGKLWAQSQQAHAKMTALDTLA